MARFDDVCGPPRYEDKSVRMTLQHLSGVIGGEWTFYLSSRDLLLHMGGWLSWIPLGVRRSISFLTPFVIYSLRYLVSEFSLHSSATPFRNTTFHENHPPPSPTTQAHRTRRKRLPTSRNVAYKLVGHQDEQRPWHWLLDDADEASTAQHMR